MKVGFKAQLDKAEKSIGKKDKYLASFQKHQKELHEKKAGEPKDPVLKKHYARGSKDMTKLLSMFSKTFCEFTVFHGGMCRKSEDSDPKLKAYCDGFNDRLLEG